MVDFSFGQDRSFFGTAGVAKLRRRFPDLEKAGLSAKGGFCDRRRAGAARCHLWMGNRLIMPMRHLSKAVGVHVFVQMDFFIH